MKLTVKIKENIKEKTFYRCEWGVDKYNNDINKYNIECNNNRVKENRECEILDIECWMFIGVSGGVYTATPGIN